jgi:hypothetical protein
MVAVEDFSGLAIWAWALASTAVSAPMIVLERCMACLQIQHLKPVFYSSGGSMLRKSLILLVVG